MEIGLFSQTAGYFEATAPDGAELVSLENGVLTFKLVDESEQSVTTIADAVVIPKKPDGPHEWKEGEWVATVAPDRTPDEKRAAMPPLQKWRVDTVIDLEPGLREKIGAAIEGMPEPNRTISRNKLASVMEFYRTDPLFDLIGSDPTIAKNPDDIDAMWEAAAALE